MKVPYSWLAEYVPGAPDAREVGERLALVGTEFERLDHRGVPGDNGSSTTEHYRVGKVVSWRQHPNADRLRLCMVDVGEDQPRQIVCGASNFDEGDRVAVVLPGGKLPDGRKLGAAKLRGEDSSGMLLSERELELSADHGGIMVLPEDWAVGTPLAQYLPLGEQVLELEITSNRPDCLAVHGVAREVSAAFDLDLVPLAGDEGLATADGHVGDHVAVEVEAEDLCPRYMARAFTRVRVGSSPAWLRARLTAAGMRPINNVVDVTNYVMLACGQPLHAFDASALRGGRIIVRRARPGEQVVTLDDVERTLPADSLVIADAERTAVIAGIMGAADVEVHEGTTDIVLEAATFSSTGIMRTSQELGLRSESSARFEKGLDPWLPEVAMRLASKLLVESCDARMVPGTIDVQAAAGLAPLPRIQLPEALIERTLGVAVPAADVGRILARLGYGVERDGDGWTVGVPHWRMYDTTRPIDLVEEVGRIHGLDRVPARMPARRAAIGGLSQEQRMQRALEDAAAGAGLHEVITYSLVPDGSGTEFPPEPGWGVARLANPMTSEHTELRTSLLPGLLGVLGRNAAAGAGDLGIFELARTWRTGSAGIEERECFGIATTGAPWGTHLGEPGVPADVASLVGLLRSLLSGIGARCRVRRIDEPASVPYLHPARCGRVDVWSGTGWVEAGWIGTVHPGVVAGTELRGEVAAAEVDVAAVLASAVQAGGTYRPISEFPPVRQDMAFMLSDDVPAGDLLQVVEQAGGDLLESVSVFDRYAGEQVPDGHHSLALGLVFRAADRTLTDEEVTERRRAITDAAAERLAARLRD